LLPFFAISGTDHIVNTGDKNSSVRCDELPQEGDEVSHRFMHGSSKDTRVQVTRWTADFNEHVDQATETVGDTWSASVEPIVIRLEIVLSRTWGDLMIKAYNADSVDAVEPAIPSPGMLGGDEFIETKASAFFHSFEDEAEIHGKLKLQVPVRLENIEPSQDRALVIGRSSSNELAVISDGQSEWIGVPTIALQGLGSKGSILVIWDAPYNNNAHGLNVKVAVN